MEPYLGMGTNERKSIQGTPSPSPDIKVSSTSLKQLAIVKEEERKKNKKSRQSERINEDVLFKIKEKEERWKKQLAEAKKADEAEIYKNRMTWSKPPEAPHDTQEELAKIFYKDNRVHKIAKSEVSTTYTYH